MITGALITLFASCLLNKKDLNLNPASVLPSAVHRTPYPIGSFEPSIHRVINPMFYLYFLLRCLNADPANVFVVELVFLLLKALLAFFATLFEVLGALAIVQSFILLQR